MIYVKGNSNFLKNSFPLDSPCSFYALLAKSANTAVLFFIPFHCSGSYSAVKQGARKSHANINLGDTVFERSPIEKVFNNHFLYYTATENSKQDSALPQN
jgi:hypothetical protein